MPRDIAIVCATPPGVNPGMDSVDLAIVQMAERHGFADRITLYRPYPGTKDAVATPDARYAYSIARDLQSFSAARAIVYWGDFVHMRQYQGVAAHHLLSHGLATDIDDARRRLRELLLLEGADAEVFGRAMSFGTTLFVNSIGDELEPLYGPALARFLKSCNRLWLRDVMSAVKACHLRGRYDDSCLGVDCALTIDPTPSGTLPSAGEATLGIFFGRTTHAPYVDAMCAFAMALAQHMALRPTWLTWGDTTAFQPLTRIQALDSVRAIDSFSTDAIDEPMRALQGLVRHRVIVTDTYHVAVNAWNLGIPAVCLAENECSDVRNIRALNPFSRRDKKYLFMSMYDALDFFVGTNELMNGDYRQARLAHVAALLQSGREVATIRERMRSHATALESSFVDTLRRLL